MAGRSAPLSLREVPRSRLVGLLTHRSLLTEVWGPGYADDVATLRTAIVRLRRKLERDGDARSRYIRTDAGVGYRLVTDR